MCSPFIFCLPSVITPPLWIVCPSLCVPICPTDLFFYSFSPYVDGYLQTIKKSHAGCTHVQNSAFPYNPIVNGKSCVVLTQPAGWKGHPTPLPTGKSCWMSSCVCVERSGFILLFVFFINLMNPSFRFLLLFPLLFSSSPPISFYKKAFTRENERERERKESFN